MKENGIISLVVLLFLLLFSVFLYPYVFKRTPPPPEAAASEYFCRDFVEDPNPPTVTAPAYTTSAVTGPDKTYRLLKKRVPMDFSLYGNEEGHHFFPYKQQYTDPATGKNYIIRIPNGDQGRSYKLPSEVGSADYLTFADYGLIYLFPADEQWNPVMLDTFDVGEGNMKQIAAPDIYKAIDTGELPEWVLKCIDAGTGGQTDKIVYNRSGFTVPPQNPSSDKQQLQLEWFLMTDYKLLLQAWWTPHCKPAVYLYPPNKMTVNVKVYPAGFLSYTDPQYDAFKGWTVESHPDGTILNSDGKIYPYLYFESKVRDEVIKIPREGWVIKSGPAGNSNWNLPLEEHLARILPEMGLNRVQTADFIDYWKKALPHAQYYFVGVIDQENVDRIEKLEINPKPDSINRVRIYFERLDEPKEVKTPDLTWFVKSGSGNGSTGFRVVEWGGMVKNDPDHPFTCSQ